MSSGTVQSQDTFVAPGIALSVVGGAGSIPQNLVVSSISVPDLINVSSINGAPVAGGANLTVSSISTLALNSISSINGVAYTGSGAIPAVLGVSSLVVNAGTVTALNNAGAPTQGRVVIEGADDGYSIQGFNNANTVTSLIDQFPADGGITLSLNPGATTGPGTLRLNSVSGVTISTLTVSSINNGPPSGTISLGGFNIVIPPFSTLTVVVPTNNPLVQFSTVVGRSYVVDFTASVQPVQPSVAPNTVPADNELGFSIVSGANAFQSDSFQTQLVYNVARGARSTFTTTNSATFLAGGTGTSLNFGYLNNDAVNFNFTNSTIVSSLTRVALTDLGVI